MRTWALGNFKGELDECKAQFMEFAAGYSDSQKKDSSFLPKVEEEMLEFLNKAGKFSSPTLIDKGKSSSRAHYFFDGNASLFPHFAIVAMRLASKPSGSGAAERDHKDSEFVYNNGRNRLGSEKVEKLKHRFSSVRMKNGIFRYEPGEANADKEMKKYWEPEDFVDPIEAAAAAEASSGGSVASVYAYVEEWEKELLTVSESTDYTARFKLSNKVKGLCMRDRDSERDPWEYRKVVDLEWSTRKSYGNKKGWLAVCELLESYHRADVQSAAEDGDQSAIREAYLINDEFYGLVLDGPVELLTRLLIKR